METYKHACPFCGNQVDYTVDYCGKSVVCALCGKLVVFPALPPGGKRAPLRLERPRDVRGEKWSFSWQGLIKSLREFEHWNMVAAGAVPFVIVVALLVGASILKKNAGEGPSAPVIPLVNGDRGASQQMALLERLEADVQKKLGAAAAIQSQVSAAQDEINRKTARSASRPADPLSMENQARATIVAQKKLANLQEQLGLARRSFEEAFNKYRQAGGQIDYHAQLP